MRNRCKKNLQLNKENKWKIPRDLFDYLITTTHSH